MWENFFAHVNIAKGNVHIPEGVTPRERVVDACAAYEDAIRAAGGIDFQLLGIGKTGHVGFNEPGSDATSRTRIVTLDTLTRKDAAADFFGVENVPREAITTGVATILDAKEIALLATGEHKAAIVARAVEGDISTDVAATFLQRHPSVTFRSEEHTSELQSRSDLVCRLLLEKKKRDSASSPQFQPCDAVPHALQRLVSLQAS